jgi:hypothetical protein
MKTQDSLELQIRELEERLLDPRVRKEVKEVAALLADDFVEFGGSGKVYDKDKTLHALATETGASHEIQDFRITILGADVVLATYRAVLFDPYDGRDVHSLRSSIWKRVNDRWQIVFHQGTPATAN